MRCVSGRVVFVLSVVALVGGLTPGAWAETAAPRSADHPGASYGLDPAGVPITVSGHAVPTFAVYPGASYGLDPAGHAIRDSSSLSVAAVAEG